MQAALAAHDFSLAGRLLSTTDYPTSVFFLELDNEVLDFLENAGYTWSMAGVMEFINAVMDNPYELSASTASGVRFSMTALIISEGYPMTLFSAKLSILLKRLPEDQIAVFRDTAAAAFSTRLNSRHYDEYTKLCVDYGVDLKTFAR